MHNFLPIPILCLYADALKAHFWARITVMPHGTRALKYSVTYSTDSRRPLAQRASAGFRLDFRIACAALRAACHSGGLKKATAGALQSGTRAQLTQQRGWMSPEYFWLLGKMSNSLRVALLGLTKALIAIYRHPFFSRSATLS